MSVRLRDAVIAKPQSRSRKPEILLQRRAFPPVPVPKLGIGIITYRRDEIACATAAEIRKYTRLPFELVIADDGSSKSAVDRLSREASVITGANRGVTWNKNRALFHLHAVRGCDVVILLEDDTRPTAPGWERPWIEASLRWGHANLAGHWFRDSIVRGAGTPGDPYRSPDFSGQCTAFSREALNHVGYLDTRYRGFGIGHVDHTTRLARAGYGAEPDPKLGMLFYLLDSALEIVATDSARKEEDVRRNHALYQNLQHEGIFRTPWATDEDLRVFRNEIESIRVD